MNSDATTRKDHWRSLNDLADTPEFRAFAQQEFPGFTNVYESLGEAEFDDIQDASAGLNRRRFLALSTAALGLAGLAGCRRPELPILPYSSVPADQIGFVVHGKPTFYATCLPRPGGALPVLVESHDGRPTKIEGNPQHPCSLGSTDVHAQAAVLDLYSPDRVLNDQYPGVMERGIHRHWEDFDRFARKESAALLASEGQGLYILAEDIHSPALTILRSFIAKKLKNASWHTFDARTTEEVHKGAQIAFDKRLHHRYRFDKAACIVSLDCDFLGGEADAVSASRAFAQARKPDRPLDEMNRLYVIEPTFTLTGTMADHRLRLPASQVGNILVALARKLRSLGETIKKPGTIPELLPASHAHEKWVEAVAHDLAANTGKALLAIGSRQPAWVHALAHAVNDALGAFEAGIVELRDLPAEPQESRSLASLAADLDAKKVRTLLVIGGNPVLNGPSDFNLNSRIKNARYTTNRDANGAQSTADTPANTLRLGLFFDQTSEVCNWHLPLAHSLESWGDAEAADGTLCCVQPLIAPLNSSTANSGATSHRGGRTALEILALLTRFGFDGDALTNPPTTSYVLAKTRAYDLVRHAFAARSGLALTDPKFESEFKQYKQIGFLAPEKDKALRAVKPIAELKLNAVRIAAERAGAPALPMPTVESLEVAFVPDYSVPDGHSAMNPWLQELPDPITKLVWDNAALLSPATATALGVQTGDIVKLTVKGDSASIEIAVFVLPGHADFCLTLPFGQFGEMRIAHVPDGGGFNVFPFRRSCCPHIVTGCRLERTGRTYDLVTTQEHGVIPEGRDILREIALATYREQHTHPKHANDPVIGVAPGTLPSESRIKKGFQGGYGNAQQWPAPAGEKQKRFSLDLARPELLDSAFQWGMVIDLNACTGCSACLAACQAENNIPVVGKHEIKRNRELHWIRIDRYFTHFGTANEAEPNMVAQPVACVHCEQAPCEQVCPVNAAVHSPEGLNLQVYNRCIGTRYCANACPYKVRRFNWFDYNKRRLNELRTPTPLTQDGAAFTESLVPETLKMQKNPDVTVRMRGVMEKCTYCIQRIERAKTGANLAAVEVAEGNAIIESDRNFQAPVGHVSKYIKPASAAVARAVGYDLDALGRVIVPDGLVVTACEEACPSRAITFGNVLDSASRLAKLKAKEAEYLLLGDLNTKPRTSYLPRIRNVNPELM